MPEILLTDSHCHLDFPDFDGKIDEILGNATKAGIHRMVSICTRPRLAPQVQQIAQTHAPVYWAGGLHPLHVAEEPPVSVEALVAMAAHPKFIGIGETGLDYHYDASNAALQKQSLARHIEAARQTELPLIIHARAADNDMADILTSEWKQAPFSCVMHCFSSGPELAKAALDCGFYLSMSGIVTFKKSDALREIFKNTPLTHILVETDAPYLAPVPYRGKRNEPAYTLETAKVGAAIFDMELAEFARVTEENFARLFSKVTKDVTS